MCDDHKGLTRYARRRNRRGALVKLPVYNGTIHLHPSRLEDVFRWKKSRRVFVNSMSDLFHPDVPYTFIAATFAVMGLTPWHTYLTLTKRASRMPDFFEWLGHINSKHDESKLRTAARVGKLHLPQLDPRHPQTLWPRTGDQQSLVEKQKRLEPSWPLPNVQLGVSAENQPWWDSRVSELLRSEAAIHWVSIEPILGDIDMLAKFDATELSAYGALDWIVVGGESGPGARRCDAEWVEHVVEQCDAIGLPVFVKQLGAKPYRIGNPMRLADSKGKDLHEWPAALQRRELVDLSI
jgi:protein gp37